MTNKNKDKGTRWERDAVKLLNDKLLDGEFIRVPTSGALGTILKEPHLMGDIKGVVVGFPRPFILEAKVGYGGSTQLTFKKEWLDKIKEESSSTNAFPLVLCRFLNSRSGTENFVTMDFDDFIDFLNEITKLYYLSSRLEMENSELRERMSK